MQSTHTHTPELNGGNYALRTFYNALTNTNTYVQIHTYIQIQTFVEILLPTATGSFNRFSRKLQRSGIVVVTVSWNLENKHIVLEKSVLVVGSVFVEWPRPCFTSLCENLQQKTNQRPGARSVAQAPAQLNAPRWK